MWWYILKLIDGPGLHFETMVASKFWKKMYQFLNLFLYSKVKLLRIVILLHEIHILQTFTLFFCFFYWITTTNPRVISVCKATISVKSEWSGVLFLDIFWVFSAFIFLQHESRETLLGFNMVNYRACKNLWKACVEHHTFFRLDRPLPPQKNFFAHYFTLGSKFRYW